jgi:hypothetical protein
MQYSRFNGVIIGQHGNDGFRVFHGLACRFAYLGGFSA